MNEDKQAGIKFLNVFVTKVKFDFFPVKEPGSNLKIDFNINNNFGPESTQLQTTLTLNLNLVNANNESTFKLDADIVGLFEEQPGSSLPLKDFSNAQASALLFPFLRELVVSITSKSLVGPVLLPLVNVPALIKAGEAKTKEKESAKK